MSQQTTSQDFYNEVNLECTQVSVKGKFKVLQQLPVKGTKINATVNRVKIECVSKESSRGDDQKSSERNFAKSTAITTKAHK